MRILNQLPPARQAEATEPSAPSVETAMRAEDAFEGEQTKALEGHSFERPKIAMWLQRFWAGAGGASLCVMASLMTTGTLAASAAETPSWLVIAGIPLFGLSSICFMKLARQYGEDVFDAFERERRHLIEAAAFAEEFARIEAKEIAEVANELAKRLVEVKTAYIHDFRTYRAEVAAEPAEGEAGEIFSPSAEVVYVGGNPLTRRDH